MTINIMSDSVYYVIIKVLLFINVLENIISIYYDYKLIAQEKRLKDLIAERETLLRIKQQLQDKKMKYIAKIEQLQSKQQFYDKKMKYIEENQQLKKKIINHAINA